jgi:hypothetical protein
VLDFSLGSLIEPTQVRDGSAHRTWVVFVLKQTTFARAALKSAPYVSVRLLHHQHPYNARSILVAFSVGVGLGQYPATKNRAPAIW